MIAAQFAKTAKFIRETAHHTYRDTPYLLSSASGTNSLGYWGFDIWCDPRKPLNKHGKTL